MIVATATLEKKKKTTKRSHPARGEGIRLVYFYIRVAADLTETPEARMLLAVIERGLIDAFSKADRSWREQAREYFRGPVFKWHVSLLGADPIWSAELVGKLFKAERRLGERDESESESVGGSCLYSLSGLGMRVLIRLKEAGNGCEDGAHASHH